MVGLSAVCRGMLVTVRLDLSVSFQTFTTLVTFETSIVLETGASMLEATVLKTPMSVVEGSSEVLSVQSVVLKDQTTSVLVLSLRVDQLKVLLMLPFLQRMLQQVMVLFLHVHWNRVEVLELDRLVGLGVFMLDVVVVTGLSDQRVVVLLFQLWCLFVDDARVGGRYG